MRGTGCRLVVRIRLQTISVRLLRIGRQWRQLEQVFTGRSSLAGTARRAGWLAGVSEADFRSRARLWTMSSFRVSSGIRLATNTCTNLVHGASVNILTH